MKSPNNEVVIEQLYILLLHTLSFSTFTLSFLEDSLHQTKGIHTPLHQFVFAVHLELVHKLSVLLENDQLLDFGRSKASPEWKNYWLQTKIIIPIYL